MARKKPRIEEKYPGIPRGRQNGAGLDEFGAETFDPEPIALKVKGQLISDMDRIRLAVHNLRVTEADGSEMETFEEADDFEVDDDYGEFSSVHEIPADAAELEDFQRFAARVKKTTSSLVPKRRGAPPAEAPKPEAPKPPTEGKPSEKS